MDSNSNLSSSLMASLRNLQASVPNPLAMVEGPYSLNIQAFRASSKAFRLSSKQCNRNSLGIPVQLRNPSNNRRRNSHSKPGSRNFLLQRQSQRQRPLRNSGHSLQA